ncbi:DUF2277 family protein [Arsenicicoccus dermatophilus]|uniref:DUF2277 family protein n=1 Tax=Arsenicicoccus dermatophilus TaxID=1076331 RepID=UPI003916FC25
MVRQLRALHDAELDSTSPEARAAALQYVRVVSGAARPPAEHREVFEATVLQIALATQRLMDELQTPVVEVPAPRVQPASVRVVRAG